jgi:hypothetical protein
MAIAENKINLAIDETLTPSGEAFISGTLEGSPTVFQWSSVGKAKTPKHSPMLLRRHTSTRPNSETKYEASLVGIQPNQWDVLISREVSIWEAVD